MHIFHGCKPVALIHSFDYITIYGLFVSHMCCLYLLFESFFFCLFLQHKIWFVMNAKSKIVVFVSYVCDLGFSEFGDKPLNL